MKIYKWDIEKMSMKKIPFFKIASLIIICLSLLIIVIGYIAYNQGYNSGKTEQITEKDVILIYNDLENENFTPRKFYNYLKEINIKFPEIVFAQSMKECGFTSILFTNNNNLFGMKGAGGRVNMQSGTRDGYGYYENWKYSVIDYALYQSIIGVHKLKTEDEYLEYLKQMNYFDATHPGNSSYISDIKNIANNIEKYLGDE